MNSAQQSSNVVIARKHPHLSIKGEYALVLRAIWKDTTRRFANEAPLVRETQEYAVKMACEEKGVDFNPVSCWNDEIASVIIANKYPFEETPL